MKNYKSIRNQALRDCNRLITGVETDTGKQWYCPDGWFATSFNIYEDYRVKKDQEVPSQNPKMEYILNGLTKTPTRATGVSEPDESGFVFISYADTKVLVNGLFLDLLNRLHDNPDLWIDTENKYAPVQMYKGSELVALLMPLKQ